MAEGVAPLGAGLVSQPSFRTAGKEGINVTTRALILEAKTFKELDNLGMRGDRLREIVEGGPPSIVVFAGLGEDLMMRCARVFCAALNCLAPEGGDACGTCPQCTAALNRSFGMWVPANGAYAGVGAARSLTTLAWHSPWDGRWRVIALTRPEDMRSTGLRQVSKLIRRPAPLTSLVFITTRPWKLPPLLRSVPSVEFGAPSD